MQIKNSLKGYGVVDLDDIIGLLQEYKDEVEKIEEDNEELKEENERLEKECEELEKRIDLVEWEG